MNIYKKVIAAAIISSLAQVAHADINIGVVASFTGPAAALGADIRKAVALMPTSLAGEKINYIMLDDATDPTATVKNGRKLLSEDKVDAIIGPNINANSAALMPVVDEGKTVMIVVAPYDPPADKRTWVFRAVQSADLMVQRVVEDMSERKVKTVGYIGFADQWGELMHKEMEAKGGPANIKVVANERYARTDTSVTAQVLKILAAKPDAVFIGASGTPAVLPQVELRQRGFTGKIYQTHGVSSKDFIRVGGKHVEGALIPVGPVLVAEQLPDNYPTRKVGMSFNDAYEKMYGPDSRSTFAGVAWDAWLLLANAIPSALKVAKPGTVEFRQAIRDNLERTKDLVGVHGVYNMTPQDHTGLDQRARVLIEVNNGRWKYVK